MLIARMNIAGFVNDIEAIPFVTIGPYQPVVHCEFEPSAGLHRRNV